MTGAFDHDRTNHDRPIGVTNEQDQPRLAASLMSAAQSAFGGVFGARRQNAEDGALSTSLQALHNAHAPLNGGDSVGFAESGFSVGDLSSELNASANDIDARRKKLSPFKAAIIKQLADNSAARASQLMVQIRAGVGMLWLLAALVAALFALATEAGYVISTIVAPSADLWTMAKLFGIVGAAGYGGAVAFALIFAPSSQRAETALREKSNALGAQIKDLAHDLDGELSAIRDRIAAPGLAPTNLVKDASVAYLKALEAKLLFDDYPFVVNADQQALKSFRRFLSPSAPSGGYSGSDMVLMLLLGMLSGAGLTIGLSAPEAFTELFGAGLIASLGFDKYPALLPIFAASVSTYVFAGVIAKLIASAPGLALASDNELKAALDALRSALAGAPSLRSFSEKVDAVVDILKARITNQGDSASHHADASHDDDIPHWRRPDEGARFVETGFLSSPTSWRADPYGGENDKTAMREPGAKRGLFDFKNRPLD